MAAGQFRVRRSTNNGKLKRKQTCSEGGSLEQTVIEAIARVLATVFNVGTAQFQSSENLSNPDLALGEEIL